MNIVLVHIDCDDKDLYCNRGLPIFMEDCIKQIRTFNDCNLYLITDTHIDDIFLNKYNINLINISNVNLNKLNVFYNLFGKDNFWAVAAARFYYIEWFMKDNNIENVIHIENDILLYHNVNDYEKIFEDTFNGMAITPGGPGKCMTGYFYIKNHKLLEHMNDYFIEIYQSNILGNLKRKYNIISMINEQVLLFMYSKELGKDFLDYFPILPYGEHSYNYNQFSSLFDPASYGQYVGGDRIQGPGVKPDDHYIGQELINNPTYDIKFEYVNDLKIPYFYYNNEKTFINNLHIHSKNLYKYLS